MCRPLEQKLTVALCDIIKKNDERKMTVTNLCKKADVSRAAFYLHYKDFDEFTEALKDDIIKKIIKESFLLLMCDDNELSYAVKKENIIFDEYDYMLLSYFTSNEKCIEFGSKAFAHAEEYFDAVDASGMLKNKMTIANCGYSAFFAGYICIIYLGLSDYDEVRFRKEIEKCRSIFNLIEKINKTEN
ncbi:MAG: TetR/AcrR family transcriptional regulator [Clostridia bacterium]|nr:TetR/AcrR family transcriptional regulator [Clostridia bacterium]